MHPQAQATVSPGVVCGRVYHHPCLHSGGTEEPAVLSASYMILNPLKFSETTDESVALEHRDHMCHCIFFAIMSLCLAQSLEYSSAVYFPWIHEVTMRTQLFHPAAWLHSSHRLPWQSVKSPIHSRSLILCSERMTGKTTLNLTCRELTLVTLCNNCPLWVLHCCCFDYYL